MSSGPKRNRAAEVCLARDPAHHEADQPASDPRTADGERDDRVRRVREDHVRAAGRVSTGRVAGGSPDVGRRRGELLRDGYRQCHRRYVVNVARGYT